MLLNRSAVMDTPTPRMAGTGNVVETLCTIESISVVLEVE